MKKEYSEAEIFADFNRPFGTGPNGLPKISTVQEVTKSLKRTSSVSRIAASDAAVLIGLTGAAVALVFGAGKAR